MNSVIASPVAAWNLSCPDWEERILTGRSLVPDLPLFHEPAVRAIKAFNMMRVPDIVGQPTMEKAAADWIREIVAALFGSYDHVAKQRMIKEVFALLPKKSSKTGYGAAIMLVALLLNERRGVEFLFVGPMQETARRAFDHAVGIIEADEYLKKRFKPRDHKKEIVDLVTKAKLKILTFDLRILTGARPAGVLLDELWVMGKSAKAANIVEQLRGGVLANPESFMVMISTQSDEPPTGVFLSELIAARMIRDGKVEGTRLPIIYEFPKRIMTTDAWKDPANWPMVLPNLNRPVTIGALKEMLRDAEIKGEADVRRFASQYLNVEIGISLGSKSWVGANFWEKNTAPLVDLDVLIDCCDVIAIGVDGGGLDDLLGFAAVGRHKVTKEWLVFCRAWVHRSVLELRQEIASKLLELEAAGELVIVEDDSNEDIVQLADIVERIYDAGLLAEKHAIGVDVVGIGAIVDEIASREIDTDLILGIPQGWKLTGAIKTTERKLSSGEMAHPGQKLMAWCLGNAKVEPRGNAILITKQTSGTAKIDPLMALFNAVHIMSTNPEASGAARGGAWVR